MFKIAILISGGGSNLSSIIDSIDEGYIKAKIEWVISDREDIYGLEIAKKHGIKTCTVHKKNGSSKILELLKGEVDLIVLAGYLSILNGDLLREFRNKIINIHPSLIPSFAGAGMYGIKVHRAAINKGVKFSGCTVHFVNKEVDGGAIISQAIVPVYFEDDEKSLQQRVLKEEHKLLPQAIKLISEGKVLVQGERVKILE